MSFVVIFLLKELLQLRYLAVLFLHLCFQYLILSTYLIQKHHLFNLLCFRFFVLFLQLLQQFILSCMQSSILIDEFADSIHKLSELFIIEDALDTFDLL